MKKQINQKLGNLAITEIRETIKRCNGNPKEIAAEVGRLALHFNVKKQRIYEVTTDIRLKRKTRADKGKRAVDLKTDPVLKLAAGWVIEYDMKPEEALLQAKQRGMNPRVELPTFTRYLREHGLDKQSRRKPRTPHVRFEAEAPGALFQFDISGTKERWYDHQTRKIVSVSALEVSKNHENTKLSRVKVWRFCLIDDFSRRIFVRYVAVAKPNSSHVVDFLLQAYSVMGVPFQLYADNDAVIKFGRNAEATKILNKALADEGGYEVIHHLPGNARATGKVERLHQAVEQDEKFLGFYLAERGDLTVDILNEKFALAVENKKNNAIHRETGEKPVDRWNSEFSVVRRLDYDLLKSAFAVDVHEVRVKDDLTFRYKGVTYQLPTDDMYPFASWATRKEKWSIVFPDNFDFFTVIGFDGIEYDIPKTNFVPAVAGDFTSVAETDSAKLRKELKQIAKDDAKQKKEAYKKGEEAAPMLFFDEDFAPVEDTGNVKQFPKPETFIAPEKIAEVAPGRTGQIYAGMLLNFWEAFAKFESEFSSKNDCKVFLDTVFSSRDENVKLTEAEIKTALETYVYQQQPIRHLKAV